MSKTLAFEIRSQKVTEDTEGTRTFSGIAVPWDTETTIFPGWREKVARGAITPTPGTPLFRDHSTPIGVITDMEDVDEGLQIHARISKTPLGDETYTLLRDGAIGKLSISFYQRHFEDHEDEDGLLRVQKEIELREISVVPFPAYSDAEIKEIRSELDNRTTKETHMTNTTKDTTAALAELRDAVHDVQRDLTAIQSTQDATAAPADTRSAGQLLKDLVAGDAATLDRLDALARWEGTTTADDGSISAPAGMKDLTRLISRMNPLMSLFGTQRLPAEGNTVEYLQVSANTIKVGKQLTEGTDLEKGKVSTEVKNATVNTYGGYTSLSIQAIERSRVNVLDKHLRALALKAGTLQAQEFATFFANTTKAQAANALTLPTDLTAVKWSDLFAMLVDAADKMKDVALPLDGLILDKKAFVALGTLEGKDGRPLMRVSGEGVNTIGTIDPKGLAGNLANLTVVPDLFAAEGAYGANTHGAFFSTEAVTPYVSPLARLQDQNVVNLTRDFSVYFYAAFAPEIPDGIIPFKTGTGVGA